MNLSKLVLTVGTIAASVSMLQASTDYGPAVWRPTCDGKWYTSGSGHKFFVIHDMEGYYLTGLAYINRCDVSVSIHYAVNGKKDTTSDAAPGEVSQTVRDSYYAWHARCWNQHSIGTEHEGFVSNPAWFTPEMYTASAALTKSKAEKFGFAKDRNHIVGHNAKSVSGWPAYASANLGIDPNCNDHSDPGANWDWSGYMAKINPPAPGGVIVDNTSAGFSVVGTWSAGSSSADKYGADYRFHSVTAVSEPATWSGTLTAGTKGVYAWWPQGSNRSTTAPYIVYHSGGTTTVNVNQQANGGTWNLLGSWSMAAGANQVKLSCWTGTGDVVVADAIKWQ